MERYSQALILGYGRSGKAAERLLQAEGATTTVLAEEPDAKPDIGAVLGGGSFDVCIVSPGFALTHPWVQAVAAAGVPLLSELELGWSRHRGRTVAVTGSNGKSTAVKWIAETLQRAGLKAAIGGNYGIPACEVAMENTDLDWLVLEVSSFQLETVRHFRAEVAVLLNLLPNHLDRHGTMEIYRRTKARIFGLPSLAGDACLAPADLLGQLRQDAAKGQGKWISFGASEKADYRYADGKVLKNGVVVLDLAGTPFASPVLGACAGTAVAAATAACGVPMNAAQEAAREFVMLPHRLQQVAEIGGVCYINDSKATNLAATAAALQACGGGIHLIAGGLPKESDFTFIKTILAERVRRVYLVGQASRAMYQAWNGTCPCAECGTLEEAFHQARIVAQTGEKILLSPGCASFDQYSGFEERGERFVALVKGLMPGGGDAS